MNKLLLVLLLAVSTACTALAQQDIMLDGEWQMTIGGRDYTVNVPHTYNIMEGLEDYAGEVVYRRSLPITADMKGRTVRLHFEAVHHDAVVYVNGKRVGEHLGKGYTPFTFDITEYLRFEGSEVASLSGYKVTSPQNLKTSKPY